MVQVLRVIQALRVIRAHQARQTLQVVPALPAPVLEAPLVSALPLFVYSQSTLKSQETL